MERGEYFTKTGLSKPVKEGLSRFLERSFDWLALITITLIILLVLIFF